ncbi:MAG TPA: galactose-1-epimerase, partial [Flavisolibacter sp.]|nr:galactose-1-epimerase [Flavisolibacter sp.]
MTKSVDSPDTTQHEWLPSRAAFRQTIDGKETDLYILKNGKGMTAAITNYGGRLVSLLVPDKENKITDVVVGFDSVQQFIHSTEPYFGATIGR